jgi:hypothetical protein
MQTMNERPVCHRAEDLVTHLYGEANGDEAQDFAMHMQQCDACRAEFSLFNEVHESVVLWRNEALGMTFTPAAQNAASPAAASFDSVGLVQHQRKLSALAAVREFFSVSPLWLRGATAFAAMLLCALGVLAVLQLRPKPVEVAHKNSGNEKVFTPQQFEAAVNERVNQKVADMKGQHEPAPAIKRKQSNDSANRILASYPTPSKTPGIRALSRKERLQLAADLHLIPGRDESEFPFVFTDEPE